MLRSPSLRLESNPLEGGLFATLKKTDNLAGAVPIPKSDIDAIVKAMKAMEINEERLAYLTEEKMPWLFSSMNLKDLVEITPSDKTRLAMIALIGPRLTDPRSKIDFFLGLFRFSEEKEKVQEILKTRTHVLSSSAFRTGFSLAPVPGSGDSGDSPAPKPLIAIPGMIQPRARVIKPIIKSKKPSDIENPPENTTKPPGRGTPLDKVSENGGTPPRPVAKKPLERIFDSRTVSPPKVPKGIAIEKKPEVRSPSPKKVAAVEKVSNLPPIPATKPVPILKQSPPVPNNVVMQMGSGTYNLGPNKRRSIPNRDALRTIVTILPAVAETQNGVHVISDDDSDSDNYDSEVTATESKNGDTDYSSDPLDCSTKPTALMVDTALTKSPSLSSITVPDSPGSCGKEHSSASKVGRMLKSLVTKKFSPKYTPLAQGGTLIARDEKEEPGLTQSKLEADLVNAEITTMPPQAIIEKKRNGVKGPKKSVRMAAPPSPPRGPRNAMSMSSANAQSQNGTVPSPDRTTIDIYASNELARSWRKSTRFVNVKSLAYDFDRMKERGEKQQKRRSQTPDRRHFPKTEEKHGDDEDDDEEKDDSKNPQPWYITDKLGPGRMKRATGNANEQYENGGRRFSANDTLAEKSNSVTGQFTVNGTPITIGLERGLSFYAKLPSEGPVEKGPDGTPLFRYQELVRMNVIRSYDGINQSDLENYMVDVEFVKCFGMSKKTRRLLNDRRAPTT